MWVFGIYNQQNVPLCDCPNGFIPKYPADWDRDDYSGGCNRRNPIQCFHGGKDIFLTISNMRLPEALPYPEVKNVEECKLNCLSHCDCNAYVYYNICLIYQGELMNLQQLSSDNKSGGDLHIRISAGSKNKISRKDAWIVGVIVAALISSIVLSIIWRVYYAVGALEEVEFSLILFKYQDIRRATRNFSQKLGEGGFGSVFKGTLPNSIAIAVKKIRSLQQGEKQFRAEVSTLGAIQHFNLLRLRGFCVEASKRFLVYEYMPKGSGRRNINMLDDEICNYFPARVAIAMNKGEDLLTLLDYKLEGNANVEELTRACKVACWCIQDDPKDRPTMGQVVKILEGIMQVGMPQIPLYFQRLLENPTEAIVYHESETSTSSY